VEIGDCVLTDKDELLVGLEGGEQLDDVGMAKVLLDVGFLF
jgi:hypothetical protein